MNVYSAAENVGLYVGTWSPGDGATRYRFFRQGVMSKGTPVADFDSGDGVYTVLGRRDALLWLAGYKAGKNNEREACING